MHIRMASAEKGIALETMEGSIEALRVMARG